MRFACFLVLLLAVAPGVSAQVTPAPAGGAAQTVQRAPAPQLTIPHSAETVEPALKNVRSEARASPVAPAAQDEPSRALWFVVGALAAVAIILALTL